MKGRISGKEFTDAVLAAVALNHARCLHAEPDGVWPTFGFPGESKALSPGSYGGQSRPVVGTQEKWIFTLKKWYFGEFAPFQELYSDETLLGPTFHHYPHLHNWVLHQQMKL